MAANHRTALRGCISFLPGVESEEWPGLRCPHPRIRFEYSGAPERASWHGRRTQASHAPGSTGIITGEETMRLRDRIALVTGAARGIGRAIAGRFAAEGALVVVTDADGAGAGSAALAIRESGARAEGLALDVTDPAAIASAFADVLARHGRLDILVNNAGVTTRAGFLDMTLEAWERVLRVNLTGTMLCGQAAARAMAAAGRGRIVNIASISGQRAGSGRAAYGASKAAIINLTAVMAIELGRHGVTVNAIAPGPVAVEHAHTSPVQQQVTLSRMALPRPARPEEVAAAAVFLASDECPMITGHVLNVDGGFNAAGIVYPPGMSAG